MPVYSGKITSPEFNQTPKGRLIQRLFMPTTAIPRRSLGLPRGNPSAPPDTDDRRLPVPRGPPQLIASHRHRPAHNVFKSDVKV